MSVTVPASEQHNAACPHTRGMSGAKVPPHVPSHLVREPDYEGANTLIDPFSVTAKMHEDFPPVFFWPKPRPGLHDGCWVVTRYADIRRVYVRDSLYSTENAANFQTLVGETFKMIPLAIDKPDHALYRTMLNSWFSAAAVDALEPAIRTTIGALLDDALAKGGFDIAHDFSRIYPVVVFLQLMGFPVAKLDEFLAWEYSILHSRGDVEKIRWGVSNALVYLRAFVEEIRVAPNDKLASHIVHATIGDRPITEDEIIGAIFFLWVGGLDTVAATSALMFRRLALEPELQQRLRKQPELADTAVEEFLRVQPLVNSTRLVLQDHEIQGVTIKRGDHVMCYNLAGNFDPDEFDAPRELRLDRAPNRHFTLAAGVHFCLGAALARRELRVALSECLRRLPPFRLTSDADRSAVPGLIAAPRVPITWDRTPQGSCDG